MPRKGNKKIKKENKRILISSEFKAEVSDFLWTYGWAILVVFVAIGALIHFGVLSSEPYINYGKCQDYCDSKVMDLGSCKTLDNNDLQVVCEKEDKQCIPYQGGEDKEVACIPYTRVLNVTLREVKQLG